MDLAVAAGVGNRLGVALPLYSSSCIVSPSKAELTRETVFTFANLPTVKFRREPDFKTPRDKILWLAQESTPMESFGIHPVLTNQRSFQIPAINCGFVEILKAAAG
jgi:hypothetical protein